MSLEGVASFAAVAAAIAAAWQLWSLRKDALDRRAAEIHGVAVNTDVITRPTLDEIVGGFADWHYEYSVDNPGRLPISNVDVEIFFPCNVRRRQWNDSLEEPTNRLAFHVAVIPARTAHPPRERVISVAESDHSLLKQAQIVVSFDTLDAGRQVNQWPLRQSGSQSRALMRRLRR